MLGNIVSHKNPGPLNPKPYLPFSPAHLQSIPEPKASAQAGARLPGKELLSALRLHGLTALRKMKEDPISLFRPIGREGGRTLSNAATQSLRCRRYIASPFLACASAKYPGAEGIGAGWSKPAWKRAVISSQAARAHST